MLHSSYEPVSPARHGFDVPWILSSIAQSAPKLIHGGVEAMLEINERAIRPDLLPQLLA